MEDQSGLGGEGKVRRWLTGLALGTVTMLALLPATGWMVRAQFGNAARALAIQTTQINPSTAIPPAEEARIRGLAQQHLDDFPLQLAAAHRLAVSRVEVDRNSVHFGNTPPVQWDSEYTALTMRFAEKPSLHANLLRFATSGSIQVRRPESQELLGKHGPWVLAINPEINQPGAITKFLENAAVGERLDPENAYFPMMSTIALFATNRDSEALQALHRAAGKREWREYYQDENQGSWQLDEALGRRGALARTARMSMILFPQYAQIRAATQTAVYLALKAEQRGEKEHGFRIRRDVTRIGSAMRAGGQSLITSLVGMAVLRRAMLRPGGAPQPSGPDNEHSEEKDGRVADAYQIYLAGIGHPEEVDWLRAEREAGSLVRGLLPLEANGGGLEPQLYTTALHWAGATLLLVSAAWWVLLGLVGAGLAATRWGRSGKPLSLPFKRGMVAAVCTLVVGPIMWTMLNAVGSISAWQLATFSIGELAAFAAMVGVPVVSIYWLYSHREKYGIWASQHDMLSLKSAFQETRGVWQCLGGIATITVLIPGVLALAMLQAIAAGIRFDLSSNDPLYGQMPTLIWMVGGALALPILAATCFAMAGRVLRVPVGISLARGFRGAAGPMICLLLLAYGGAVLATSRQEAKLDYTLNRTVENEGKFIAEIAGKPWPGPTH